MSSTNIERALKTEISRQVGQKNWESKVGIYHQCQMVECWKELYKYAPDTLPNKIWVYAYENPEGIWWKGDSSLIGELTKIVPYTDKKGITKPAHFTHNNYYVGSVKALGALPTSYTGNFRIDNIKFNLDLTKLPDLIHFNDVYLIHHLFSPKPELSLSPVARADYDSEDEPIGKKTKTVKKTVKKTTPPAVSVGADYDSEEEPIGKLVRQNAVRK